MILGIKMAISQQKLKHLDKLKQEYEDALAKYNQYKVKLTEDGCDHPEKHRHTYSSQEDNGYGKWYTVHHTVCLICREYI